jgi:hypothetical protein
MCGEGSTRSHFLDSARVFTGEKFYVAFTANPF